MVEQKSSFIPTAHVRAEASVATRSRKIYILTYISFVLFFGVAIAVVVVFFIGFQDQHNLELQQNKLDKEFKQFSEDDLIEVQELSVRLTEAKKLLDQTVSTVSIMTALEAATVQSVTISSLAFTKQDDGHYLLELMAKAPYFNAVRYQRELITGNSVLAGASITQTTYGTLSGADQSINLSSNNNTTNEEVVNFTISKVLSVEDIPHLITSTVDQFKESSAQEQVDIPLSEDSSVSASDVVSEALPGDELFGDLETYTINNE